jgi:putative flippase GtrA
MSGRQSGVRYVVVGGCNTLFGFAVFAALDLVLAEYIGHYFVLAVATAIGIVFSHTTQRHLVWLSDGPYVPELARFASVYAGFFLANLVLLYVAHSILDAPVIPAQIVITLVIVFGTFLVHRSWTFGLDRSPSDAPQTPLK